MDSTAADAPAPLRTEPARELGQRELIAMLGMATAAAALGIDTMLPAFGEMRTDLGLGADSPAIGNIITFYFAGMAVGQLFWGPLADRFGRRRTLHVSLLLYAVAAVAAALSPTLAAVVITRSLWGFAAAGPRIVAMTVVRDSFQGMAASQAMSSLMAVFIVVPIVAPSIGAGFVAVASWRLLFAFCALFGVVMLVWSSRLPETLRPDHRMDLSARRIASAGRRVLANRQSAGYLLAVTALMGAFVAYLSGFENVIDQAYDRASAFPFIFGGLAAVMGVMMVTNRRLVGRFGAVRVARAAFAGEVLVAAAGVAVAGATDGRPPLWLFLALMAGLLSCQAVLLPNLTSMALEPMGAIAGVASSVIGAFQTAGGAVLGGVVMSTFDDTTRPLLVGFLVFALLGSAFVAVASRGQTA